MDDNDLADLRWRVSPRFLLFLFPGYLRLQSARRGITDGLTLVRDVWLSFTAAVLLMGLVVYLIQPGPAVGSVVPWIGALGVSSTACLAAAEVFGGRPLACSDPTSLAGSYRTRFFARTAFSEAIAVLAFVATFVTGRWWLYVLFLPLTLVGFARNAPTAARLRAYDRALVDAGCTLSLVDALRGPSPPAR